MKQLSYVLENEKEVLTFVKERYPMYHMSNVFFRDIQFGIRLLLERKGMKVGYSDSEKIANTFVEQLMSKKILTCIDGQSWVLNYPEFRKPPVQQPAAAKQSAPAAKPAAPAPAVPRPAAGLPPLKSAPVASTPRPTGGLPPLKSSNAASTTPSKPVATKSPDPALPAATPTPEPAPAPAAARPSQVAKPVSEVPTGKAVPRLGAKALPPIKSSTPVGNKK